MRARPMGTCDAGPPTASRCDRRALLVRAPGLSACFKYVGHTAYGLQPGAYRSNVHPGAVSAAHAVRHRSLGGAPQRFGSVPHSPCR